MTDPRTSGPSIAERYRRWREYRATLSELSALNARELSDIGLDRGMIRYVARSAVYGAR